MDIRPLTDDYAVSPQIAPADIPEIAAAGYTTVICNRPDGEIPPDLRAAEIRRAAEAAGLKFVENPVVGGSLTLDDVSAQAEAIRASNGPVLAYCASGNRSSIVWALAHAGTHPTQDLISIPARHGYNLEPFRQTIEQLAQR